MALALATYRPHLGRREALFVVCIARCNGGARIGGGSQGRQFITLQVAQSCFTLPINGLTGKDTFPVVQVTWEDAAAYARWSGKRLPTEAEYEYAARGGIENAKYAWGNELQPTGRWATNIFQGHFPDTNTGEDGYIGTSPVTAFPPNGYGLYDMGGNVWEWCQDWYRSDAYVRDVSLGKTVTDPRGPDSSYDPGEPGVKKRVLRGGSFLCNSRYCRRYLVGSRGKEEPGTSTSNIGFRCVR
jgi:formylglycine-generating enzyme